MEVYFLRIKPGKILYLSTKICFLIFMVENFTIQFYLKYIIRQVWWYVKIASYIYNQKRAKADCRYKMCTQKIFIIIIICSLTNHFGNERRSIFLFCTTFLVRMFAQVRCVISVWNNMTILHSRRIHSARRRSIFNRSYFSFTQGKSIVVADIITMVTHVIHFPPKWPMDTMRNKACKK